MRNGWRGAFVMVLETVSLSMGIAFAGSGLIMFSGAVVYPTCAVASAGLRTVDPAAPPSRGTCAGGDPTKADVRDSARFERVVVRLTDHESLPLLSRFSDEAAAASPNGQRPLLVVQTYD